MIYSLEQRNPDIADNSVFIAPGAAVIGNVELASDSSVWFGAVLRGDIERITIGQGSNIQDGSVLHTDPGHPLTIGKDVTVGHLVMLHGCKIGDNSLIGIGSTVMNGASIGSDSIVGAHSLVTEGKSFPDCVLILGVPAEIARELSAEEIARLPDSARRYSERAKSYLNSLSPLN